MLTFEEARVETTRGPRNALVVTPIVPIVLGSERLDALRANLRRGIVDEQIARAVRSTRGRAQLILFSALGPGGAARLGADPTAGAPLTARWGFDPALSDEAADELGYLLTMSQLPTWRRLVVAGVQAHVHTDWGVRETAACRRGVARARAELEKKSDPVSRFDAWILSYLSMFFSFDLRRAVRESLGDKLGLIEQRAARTAELVAALPPSSIA